MINLLGLIIWIIIIVVIVRNVKANQERQKQIQEEYSKKFGTRYEKKDSDNSYYSNNKVDQYKQMHRDHDDHLEMEDDVCGEIGYKRCPQCDTLISKKSDTCFMCNYSFMNVKKNP